MLKVARTPQIIGARTATAYERYWDLEAERLERSALRTIRRAAGQWATTIGVLTGVFSIAALIKGPNDIADLTTEYSRAVGILVGVALLAAISAVTLAALAAQGVPREVDFSGESARRLYREEVSIAAQQLSWSRVLAVLSVSLVAVAVALIWYGPSQSARPSPGPTVLVLVREGTLVCGSLEGIGSSGRLVIRPKNGQLESVLISEIVALSELGSCP